MSLGSISHRDGGSKDLSVGGVAGRPTAKETLS